MSFNINSFNSNIGQWGVAKVSHFDVFFTIPSKIPSSRATVEKLHLAFRIETAEMPGQSLATVNQRIYGPERKMAYGNIYTDMNMSMLCSYNLREKVFFDEWLDFISHVNPDSESSTRYDIAYWKDYVTNVVINQYDPTKSKSPVYAIKLIGAFPIAVAPLALNHDGGDLHKLNITLAYHRWELTNVFSEQKLFSQENKSPFGAFAGVFGTIAGVVASQLPAGAAQAVGAATAIPSIMRNVGF